MAESGYKLICPRCYRPVQSADPMCQGCGARPEHTGWAKDPVTGRIIDGKYRIDARLGAGGMGAVFRATHVYGTTDLGQVVIKFLLNEHVQDADRRARFVKEARAARELRSPHVVKVFDFGEDTDGTPFLVMEYLEGESLFRVLQNSGLLPVHRALLIASQVAEAMVECHEKGILHRDLKPDNLLLLDSRSGDFVKIVDFGIARLPVGPATGPEAVSLVSSLVIGTPRYMAPEQILGKPIDARIDIFALGVILFEMMCGCSPIALKTGDNEMAYVALNVSDPPRKVSDLLCGVPPELDALVDRMMAKGPDERPATMADVLLAIEQVLKLSQIQAMRSSSDTVVTQDEALAQLLSPREDPSLPPQPRPKLTPDQAVQMRRSFTTTLSMRRHYLVPALCGAVIALTLLVLWLLNDRQQAEVRGRPVVVMPVPARVAEPPVPAQVDLGPDLGIVEPQPAPPEPEEEPQPQGVKVRHHHHRSTLGE